jgi:putative ABC transport system ATP-binding protein
VAAVTPPALSARSLFRFFRNGSEETLALQGVSLELAAGELVTVAGPSGSGKSTLLACLAGLDEPDGGSVTLAGEPLTGRTERERTRLRGRWIGVLRQSANLIEHLTVAQNLDLAQRLGNRAVRPDPRALLARLGIEKCAGEYPSRLSGGEVARAGLAVALSNDPPVVLADEPTGELDSATEDQVLGLLQAAAWRGAAVLVATHAPAVTAAAHRTIVLHDGRVAA